jgi:formylglycine-generating enzyme required for sulfatase activity/dienelactone hydrolase
MTTDHKSEREIFLAALERRVPEEQEAFLEEACAGSPNLLHHIKALLAANEIEDSFLQAPAFDPDVTLGMSSVSERPGMVIGRYKLLERIGEGGMAVVYMAEQTEPIRREVALKIIKLGMDTRQVIARFEAERQALAMMDHPSIAKVLDAGATETGRPYFVMELVPGVSMTTYCDQSQLDTRQRLELFVQVCHAVQHAHQKGIIHRDLKPSNVMVAMHDDKPVPKVIDFGIAKATNQRLTEKTLFTRYAHIIGTPAYMSPEQAQMSGLDVDTRTDIYSLGVLLYELLTGTTPFGPHTLQEAGYTEIERIIRETEPPKPSTRLRSLGPNLMEVARERRTSGEALRKLIKGDLDWIVMKCLEKDRTRRYATAHTVAEDVERHLRNEPILAGSPGLLYRARKFWRRHRLQIAALAVVTVLLTGLVVAVVMYRHASNLQWAKGEVLPQVVAFVKEGNYRAAFPLARQARKYIPGDPTLADLWPRICKDYSVATTPAGADIWCRDYSAMDEPWQYLGRSPLEKITLPQGMYRWRIEKPGFARHECVVGNSFEVWLREDSAAGQMVWIDAFTAEIPVGSDRQSIKVEVPAHLIDRYEITNEQFKTFVDEGGYDDPKYWQGLDFVKEGRQFSWNEAMDEFRDQTGEPGPSTWKGGTYTEGQGQHPVSGISWFEAAAYARFVGKSLPTVHHWGKAACRNAAIVIVPFSNFGAEGTAPVGSRPGTGRSGLYDMAGNAKEWCSNATDDSGSHRYILGGGWGEQTYMFTSNDFRPPWDRSAVNGFRCAKYLEQEEPVADALFGPLEKRPVRDYAREVPCSDEEYQIIKRQFEYDPTPLKAVVESVDDSSPFWRKEKITFDAAYDGERVTAYLFIPRSSGPPYQAVVYWPGGGATETPAFRGLPERDFTEPIITGGRALLFPVYKGTFERRLAEWPDPRETPVIARDLIVHVSKDLRRSIDYLETRDDIDKERIAYYGMSGGAAFGPLALAVEDRLKTAVLVVGGFYVWVELPAAIDSINHAPRVKTPVLMVNGKEDFFFPVETSQVPMFELLGTPVDDREHRLYPGGHGLFGLFSKQIRGDVLGWLDRYLGPVNGTKNDTK